MFLFIIIIIIISLDFSFQRFLLSLSLSLSLSLLLPLIGSFHRLASLTSTATWSNLIRCFGPFGPLLLDLLPTVESLFLLLGNKTNPTPRVKSKGNNILENDPGQVKGAAGRKQTQ